MSEIKDVKPISEYAEDAYLTYSIMTVKDRALPQVEDGQKPVQKRILFSMWESNLTSDAKHVKAARTVGEVLGKYHPHSDQAVFDAMVRMAQPFSLRYPLIDGQGNFGSRDGHGAAAMRYVEARLSPYADLLLSEIYKGTVDFLPNYDNTKKEPKILPARLPFVLLNGAMGIAVGMATNMPSHNLREVATACCLVLDNPKATLDQILEHIPAPDFAVGSSIVSTPAEIKSVYETGRGPIRVKGKYKIEELARGQWQVIFYEIPPETSVRKVIEELDALYDPKPKKEGQKLSQEQLVLKNITTTLIDAVRDESDREVPIRLVIEPKSSKVSKEDLINFLWQNTSLQNSVAVNITCVGIDGRPEQKTLTDILREWAAFRVITVTRRTQFRLNQVNTRLHILEGRLLVLLHLDEVIAVIKAADDPKKELMDRFTLSDAQAEDILEIRLRQLARLESVKIEKEKAELELEKVSLEKLLANEKLLRKLVIKEVQADATKYGDDRRSSLDPAEASSAPVSIVKSLVVDEPVSITLTKNGWLKSFSGHGIDFTLDTSPLVLKAGDTILSMVETRTVNPVVLLDTRGRVYTVQASDIPSGKGDGVPITSLIEIQDGAKIAYAISGGDSDAYVFAGTKGYGFIAFLKSLVSRLKAGKVFLTLDDGEVPVKPLRLAEGDAMLACGSSDGRLLTFPLVEVKQLDKGKGIVLMKVGDATLCYLRSWQGPVLEVATVDAKGAVRSRSLSGDELTKYTMHRANKGCALPKKEIPVLK